MTKQTKLRSGPCTAGRFRIQAARYPANLGAYGASVPLSCHLKLPSVLQRILGADAMFRLLATGTSPPSSLHSVHRPNECSNAQSIQDPRSDLHTRLLCAVVNRAVLIV
jgi:hypothetical protein